MPMPDAFMLVCACVHPALSLHRTAEKLLPSGGAARRYGLRMALMWHYVLTLHYKPHAERFLYHVTLEERLRVIWSSMCFERVRATARNARTDDCNNPTMLTVSNDFEKGPMLGNRPVKKQDKAGEGANQGRRARLRSRGSM